MAKKRTNIFEMLLNELLVGKTIYDDDDIGLLVDSIRFHSKTSTVYAISASGDVRTFFINDTFDIDTVSEFAEDLDVSKIKKIKNKNRN